MAVDGGDHVAGDEEAALGELGFLGIGRVVIGGVGAAGFGGGGDAEGENALVGLHALGAYPQRKRHGRAIGHGAIDEDGGVFVLGEQGGIELDVGELEGAVAVDLDDAVAGEDAGMLGGAVGHDGADDGGGALKPWMKRMMKPTAARMTFMMTPAETTIMRWPTVLRL